jgi:hypothetical protein
LNSRQNSTSKIFQQNSQIEEKFPLNPQNKESLSRFFLIKMENLNNGKNSNRNFTKSRNQNQLLMESNINKFSNYRKIFNLIKKLSELEN